jgi:hypothetical protein
LIKDTPSSAEEQRAAIRGALQPSESDIFCSSGVETVVTGLLTDAEWLTVGPAE